MNQPLPRIGFIGLGAMGAAMALRLAHKSYPMVVLVGHLDTVPAHPRPLTADPA